MQKRAGFASSAIFVWLSQVTLIWLINRQVLGNGNAYTNLGAYPTTTWIVMSRFICCVMLHLALNDELKQGFDCMKYALNHPWRFANWRLAFFTGFLQTSSVMFNEVCNILVILYSTETMAVVMNFLALVVISDFDDFFYRGLRCEAWKDFLTDQDTYGELLMIERTSSHRAANEKESHRLTEEAIDIKDEALLLRLKACGDLPEFIH